MGKGDHRIPGFLLLWLVVSSTIVFWDVFFVLLRPRSMKGGDLFWIWKPYDTYIHVDKLYGKMNDTFVVGQTLMNIVENTINIAAVSLHFKNHPACLVVGLVGFSTTLGKTLLYSLLDVLCNFCHTGHNDLTTLVFLYILPNGLWIVFPFIGVITLGNKIVHLLNEQRTKQKQR